MVTNARSQSEAATLKWQVSAAWLALAWGLLIGPVLISFALPPQHEASDLSTLTSGPSGTLQNAFIDGVHLLVLAIGAGAILLSTRFTRPLGAGVGLWFGAMTLSLGPIVSSLFSTGLFLPPDVIRMPLFFTAVYLLPRVSLDWFVRRCKSAIEIYALATLAAVVLMPARALQTDYGLGLVEAFSFRLHGIANHANNYAPILLVYLILGWMAPARTIREHLALFMVGGSLLLTQSKTVFIAAVVVYGIRFFYAEGMARYVMAYAGAVFSVAGLMVLTFVRPTWDRGVIDFFVADNDFTTFTGRTTVWEYGLDLWRAKPLFGYGIDYWYIEMSENFAAIYSWVPHHAHNQVVQTLGESGLLGLAGMIIFLVMLIVKAIRHHRLTHGASIGLVTFLILRGITEAPISGSLDENFFIVFVIFTVLILADRSEDEPLDDAPESSPQPNDGRASAQVASPRYATGTAAFGRTPGEQANHARKGTWQTSLESKRQLTGDV